METISSSVQVASVTPEQASRFMKSFGGDIACAITGNIIAPLKNNKYLFVIIFTLHSRWAFSCWGLPFLFLPSASLQRRPPLELHRAWECANLPRRSKTLGRCQKIEPRPR